MTIISCLFTSVKYELSNNFEKCREAENLRITDAVWGVGQNPVNVVHEWSLKVKDEMM